MTFTAIVKQLKKAGWVIKEQKGSHVQMIHATKPGKITIPKHGNKDLKTGTLKSIKKHAGLDF
jgi:predicted RNA binding protein YcfA (HicA-like mRNA interferase family)